jgi:hypothetical protein
MTQVTEVPVLFLVFNRPDTTARVMEAIRAARPERLYVAADGPRDGNAGEAESCAEVRRLGTQIDWRCKVRTLFRERNLGCRHAVSSAITWFFEQEPEGIILEDDCLPSIDFFPFCADLLERYRDDERVMTICGSAYADSGTDYPSSYYFSYYADMWGWATWRRAWQHYDCRMTRWPAFKAQGGLEALAAGRPWHSAYWAALFDATYEQRIDTWDYPWIYTVIEQGGLACCPARNMISNLGWGADATHTFVSTYEGNVLANRPHAKLEFPLVHPNHFVRAPAFEQEIELVRLRLHPPVRTSLKRRTIAAARRRIGRLRELGTLWSTLFQFQLRSNRCS